jgi:Glu-tRNA(Gln) amidotransferase subunit E-like FAD-binding protein
MTVLLIVLTVLIVVVPLIAIPVGAFAIMKLQRRVIDKVTNVALEQRLQREGVATIAQVLDAADTGGRVDAIYLLVRLRLQVAAADGVEEFVTEIVAALSPVRVAQIVPGATVKVRVDPLSREVVLDQPRT